MLVESNVFQRAIIALILINAVILGLETYPQITARYGDFLWVADKLILGIFVAEIALRLIAHRSRFFKDPWSLFDAIVVSIALIPTNEAFSILRALRVLRVLRLISAFPQLRRVLQGLLSAIPGLGSIAGLLAIFIYVFAVMASKLFGEEYPQWFGGLLTSVFTLFQIMTLEGWADIAREVKKTHPYAWFFFVSFILLSTFTMLNLLVAVIVDTMHRTQSDDGATADASLGALQEDVAKIQAKLDLILENTATALALRDDRDKAHHRLRVSGTSCEANNRT